MPLVIKWIYNIVCSEGRNARWYLSLLIDVYALSDVSLRRRADRLKIPGPFLLKSDVNLFNHLVRKADIFGLLILRVHILRWHEVAPYSVYWFACLKLFYVKLMHDQLIRYLRHNWLFDVVWWPPRTLWYVDDNHYHFTGPFRWKRYQKKHRRR